MFGGGIQGWLVVVFVVVEGLGNSKGVRRVGIHVQYQTEKKVVYIYKCFIISFYEYLQLLFKFSWILV